MTRHTPQDAVAVLRRWEDSGAVWRVLERDGARVTVGLWTCTGDELVDRVEAQGRALEAFVAGRGSSEDPSPPPAGAP
ncbi:hypothetical protein [Cellulomonas dongxiuzhuiae]|uniref:hypothetical protein n=1 Tax=Cellulomonas dongxiuzhuiae TaxID=2819979 RepID=UPI001AAEE5CB|nr:hypothetical protein [Cellulomonas dongxiuzhuiae]MBO3086795.1 hypothetical protein [Cellulomonas dongxiuzhuiae]